MSGMLEFGTAGLRGRLGGGPNRMNRAVVIRAAAGLTAYLRTLDPEPFVVVGYDARTNSDVFAHDTCAVVTGMGGRAVVLPHPLPTPVLAYAIRYLGADAGVMVTASHNPPRTTGTRSTWATARRSCRRSTGSSPSRSRRVQSVASVPLADDGWDTLGDDVLEAYLTDVVTVLDPASPRDVTVVHTALHGVGVRDRTARVRARPASSRPLPVASQAEPDPMFPTVSFPNPEEPGAMDAALELAEQTSPDLVVANDPDADRCAVAVPEPGGWRMLRGDEVGALLGAHLLARGVSGRLPGRRRRQLHRLLAAARGDVPGGGRAARGDADRLQVDRARARPALRLRGGARLLRGPRARPGQGRRLRGAARLPSSPPSSRRRGARWPTASTTWPASTACTPPTRSRCGSRTSRSSVG